ncbi:IS701 family transposase [Actinosynnema sp. NPDC091369]
MSSTLTEFCEEVFSSLGRSDQRKWAETYVRGLLSVPGRKSIRRISELVVGRDADQSLQQFVNQSPWLWAPVRRALAERVGLTMRTTAWVVHEVVFPKNGDSSVGVARQFAPSVGRMLNCQRSMGLFLAGEDGGSAVNWRLVMPRSWDDDAERRAKARVPDGELAQPAWQYVLDAVDEMVGDWGLTAAPIVVDLSSEPEGGRLLEKLEERGLHYLARVPAGTPALPKSLVGANSRPPTVGALVIAAAKRGRRVLSWLDQATGTMVASNFVMATVPGIPAPGLPAVDDPRRGRVFPRLRHVVAEWPTTHPQPRAVWLTNLGGTGIAELVGLLKVRERVESDVAELAEGYGLRHFEGRSFQGWHHHATLSSVAQAYALVQRLERRRAELERLRPYA